MGPIDTWHTTRAEHHRRAAAPDAVERARRRSVTRPFWVLIALSAGAVAVEGGCADHVDTSDPLGQASLAMGVEGSCEVRDQISGTLIYRGACGELPSDPDVGMDFECEPVQIQDGEIYEDIYSPGSPHGIPNSNTHSLTPAKGRSGRTYELAITGDCHYARYTGAEEVGCGSVGLPSTFLDADICTGDIRPPLDLVSNDETFQQPSRPRVRTDEGLRSIPEALRTSLSSALRARRADAAFRSR